MKRKIPSSGELLPVIGLGTWKTFDTTDRQQFPVLKEVLGCLHRSGGSVIDSSPMYGEAENVIGELTSSLQENDDFFYATKVWTNGREAGISQMQRSMKLMNRKTMDLMQIHNLTDWKTHLPVLREWKEQGIIRYIGITHYLDGMHEALEEIIRSEKIDFVQFNYSIDSNHAEKSLLKTAADFGVATLINRPFGEGRLIDSLKHKVVPAWAKDAGYNNWGAFLLAYILAHPAVTCVIPATSNPLHAAENFQASSMKLPDEQLRMKMCDFVKYGL